MELHVVRSEGKWKINAQHTWFEYTTMAVMFRMKSQPSLLQFHMIWNRYRQSRTFNITRAFKTCNYLPSLSWKCFDTHTVKINTLHPNFIFSLSVNEHLKHRKLNSKRERFRIFSVWAQESKFQNCQTREKTKTTRIEDL
jgi:hypothetical protein